MEDRVSIYPGRVTLTPVAGQANTYDMVRADSPTQEGTPLNKNNLLKDSTAALYGLGEDAVPDEVLAKAKELIAANSTAIANGVKIVTGSYVGTGTYGSSNPCSLTFDFEPKEIHIFSNLNTKSTSDQNGQLMYCFSGSKGYAYSSASGVYIIHNKYVADFSGNTINWYSLLNGGSAESQMNIASKEYHYICIG